jgi:hypothetical protein
MPVLGTNSLIRQQHYTTGYGTAQASTTTSYQTLSISHSNYTGTRKLTGSPTSADVCTFEKQNPNSHLLISCIFPWFITPGGAGFGLRLLYSLDGAAAFSSYTVDAVNDGPADRWGMAGYGGNTAYTARFQWDSEGLDKFRSTDIQAHTGTFYFYIQWANWSAADTSFPLTYSTDFPKYGTIICKEYLD